MTSRIGLIGLAVLCALTIGACGGDDGDPVAVAEEFTTALLESDGETACDLLSEDLVEEAADSAGGSCPDAFDPEALTDEDREKGADATFELVDESDDTATVEIAVPDEDPETIDLIKEDGDWRISAIG